MRAGWPTAWVGVLAAGACNAISGVGDLEFQGPGAGGAPASSSAQSTGDPQGGGGGGACAPGEAPCACTPGEAVPCYDGPPGTNGVGPCAAGIAVCDGDGAGWGPCTGQVIPAAEDCATAEDEDCDGVGCGGTLWALRFGDGGDQRVEALAVDGLGNVYAAGTFTGTIALGDSVHGPSDGEDGYLVKLDPRGGVVWSRWLGGATSQRPHGLSVGASGEVAVVGSFEAVIDLGGGPLTAGGGANLFAAKLDAAGDHVWSLAGGAAADQYLNAAAVLPSGDVVVAGSFTGAIDLGNGQLGSAGALDVVVARLASATGAGVWSRRFGFGGDQRGYSLALDPAGDVVVAGHYSGGIDLGGGGLPPGGSAGFVAKLAGATGDHLWSSGFSPSSQLLLVSAQTDGGGNVLVTGELDGSVDLGGGTLAAAGQDDVVLAKLGPGGAHLWSKVYGDAADQYASSVATDPSGDVLVMGRVAGTADFGGGPIATPDQYAPFVAKLAPDGSHVWSRRLGDGGDGGPLQLVTNVGVDPVTGRVALAFHTGPAIDLGTGVLPAAGSFDVVIALLAP